MGGYLNSWDYPNCLYQFNARGIICFLHGFKSSSFGTGKSGQTTVSLGFSVTTDCACGPSGRSFGLSGAILQGITRNPLADTGILGINAGAGLAVILFISFIETTSITMFALPLVALVGGLLAAVGILVIAYHHRLGLTPVRMVLAGVILSTGISALTLLITSKIDTEKYRFVTMWQAGSIWGSNWFFVGALLPWLVIGFFCDEASSSVGYFSIGDETAISVGIAVKKNESFRCC